MEKNVIINILKAVATLLLITILMYSNVGTVKLVMLVLITVLVTLNIMGFKLHYEEED